MAVRSVKKLYLIEEDKLPEEMKESTLAGQGVQQRPSTAQIAAATAAAAASKEMSSPFTSQTEKQIQRLNVGMKKIIKNKTLPVKLRVLAFLRELKDYLNYMNVWQQEENAKAYRPQYDAPGMSVVQPKPPAEDELSAVAVDDRPASVDPRSLLEFGRERELFNPKVMSTSLPESDKKLKPKFNKVIKTLEKNPKFKWDVETGEVMLNNLRVPGSNIKDLVLHKVRSEADDKNPRDPPPSFKMFDQFLEKQDIKTKMGMRRSKTVSSPSSVSKVVTKPAVVKRLRKKKQSSTVTGSGFLRY